MRARRPDRREVVVAGVAGLFPAVAEAQAPQSRAQAFMARAFEMKRQAEAAGDQGFGAVVVHGDRIIGESPSKVVTDRDPTAHAEMSAIREAGKRRETLSGAILYSTFRPCSMCRAAAAWVGIAKMVHGSELTDAGRP